MFSRKTIKWWKKVFVRLFEFSVINNMIIYHNRHPDLANKYQSHKKYREELIHELVQPLLDRKVDENVYPVTGPRPIAINDNRLQGKHFPESKHPQRKTCTLCGYKKKNGKQIKKKTSNFCVKCEKFICKGSFEKYHTQRTLESKTFILEVCF